MCAGGPPKPVRPIRVHSPATVRSGTRCGPCRFPSPGTGGAPAREAPPEAGASPPLTRLWRRRPGRAARPLGGAPATPRDARRPDRRRTRAPGRSSQAPTTPRGHSHSRAPRRLRVRAACAPRLRGGAGGTHTGPRATGRGGTTRSRMSETRGRNLPAHLPARRSPPRPQGRLRIAPRTAAQAYRRPALALARTRPARRSTRRSAGRPPAPQGGCEPSRSTLRRQLPVKCAGRFCMNAITPSMKSSDPARSC
jgi:hypothetical protein